MHIRTVLYYFDFVESKGMSEMRHGMERNTSCINCMIGRADVLSRQAAHSG